ncbi:MAG: protoporphyrinogen/coproporphyrinogen oxidase [Patescibacteria group bacterium]
MKDNPRIIIFGAGPCGLGAAWRLRELGFTNFHIFEKENYPGGLATSFIDKNGFTWDIGGHVTHSHYAYFDAVLDEVMGGDYYTHTRRSWVWIYHRLVPYPLQNNIHFLPPPVFCRCLDDLKTVQGSPQTPPTNFEEWLKFSFGRSLARVFLLPYNRKQWTYPLSHLGYQWVADRVARVDLTRLEERVSHGEVDSVWGPNYLFRFPKQGGTGEIWRRAARRFLKHLTLTKAVVKINVRKKLVNFNDDSSESYDLLLTTIPLDLLLSLLDDSRIKSAPSGLAYSSVTLVGLGLAGEPPEALRQASWIYFPQREVPFYRATVLSNYAASNSPSGTWSLLTEISSSKYRPPPAGDLAQRVFASLVATKLISKKTEVISRWIHHAPHGYPTPLATRDAYLAQVLPTLERDQIFSRGRFGAWKYEVSNQDHSFMQGVEWVNRMLLGEPESTLKLKPV